MIYFFIFNLFFDFLAFLFYDYLNVKFDGNNWNNMFNKKDWIDSKVRPFVNYFLSKLVKNVLTNFENYN